MDTLRGTRRVEGQRLDGYIRAENTGVAAWRPGSRGRIPVSPVISGESSQVPGEGRLMYSHVASPAVLHAHDAPACNGDSKEPPEPLTPRRECRRSSHRRYCLCSLFLGCPWVGRIHNTLFGASTAKLAQRTLEPAGMKTCDPTDDLHRERDHALG